MLIHFEPKFARNLNHLAILTRLFQDNNLLTGISRPLKARNKSKAMIMLKIAFVWVATVLISCPIAVAGIIDSSNIYHDGICLITNRYYMIYGSTFAFLIPCLIMLITYVKTTHLLTQQSTLITQDVTASSQPIFLRRSRTQRYSHNKRIFSIFFSKFLKFIISK